MEEAIHRIHPAVEILKFPLADGGEGFMDAVSCYTNAKLRFANVMDPLFHSVSAPWLLSVDGTRAFIEMAKASGLQLLHPSQYDCRITSSYGTGQLVNCAIQSGAREIIIGVGGSATNDGGMGMAVALGYRFLDKTGREINPVGKNLIQVERIETPPAYPHKNLRFIVATDVENFLIGDQGATKVFARQKGATETTVAELERGMTHFAEVVSRETRVDVSALPGGGAAGGLGAALVAFLNAKMISGADLLLAYSHAAEQIAIADLVITGEGKFDEQTLRGKLVSKVANLAKRHNTKLVGVFGRCEVDIAVASNIGIQKIFQLVDWAPNLEEAISGSQAILGKIGVELGKQLLREAKNE